MIDDVGWKRTRRVWGREEKRREVAGEVGEGEGFFLIFKRGVRTDAGKETKKSAVELEVECFLRDEERWS